jgi:hypothetical protein
VTLLADAERQLGILNGGSFRRTFVQMVELCGWGTRTEPLPSGISHGLPWGFSLAMSGDASEPPQLRWLVEPQDEDGSAEAYWRAGMRVAAWIAEQPGASIERLRIVEDLFVPDDDAPFRIWFGAAPASSLFKVYLPLRARGGGTGAGERLAEAMRRLGCRTPVGVVGEPTILSLDLCEGGRVKVYELRVTDELPGELAPFAELVGRRRIGWLIAHVVNQRPIREMNVHFSNSEARDSGAGAGAGAGAGTGADSDPDPVPDSVPVTATAAHLSVLRHPVPHERIEAFAQRAVPRLPLHFVSFQLRDGAPTTTVYFLPTRSAT